MRNVNVNKGFWKVLSAICLLAIIAWLFALDTVYATDHFSAPIPSSKWADYMGSFRIDGVDAQIGDEVAFFDQGGTLLGLYVVDTPGQYGVVHVYGDDALASGSQLTLKIWDDSAALELSGPDLALTSGSPLSGSSFMVSSIPPVWEDQKGFVLNIDTATHFPVPIGTPFVSSYIGNLTILDVPVEVGDEVAVFDPDGILCGYARVTVAGQYGVLHVYGDDPDTPKEENDEGAVDGDTLAFRIWDKSAGIQYDGVNVVLTAGSPVGSFAASQEPPVWTKDAGYVLDIQVLGEIVDTDDDGISDDSDQCPDTPPGEVANADGCGPSQTDTDSDGVMEDADQCPNTPSGEVVNTDGCSLSQTDTDGDGVMDDTDQCSGTPLGEAANTEGCSLSQTDTDGDGVMDDADQCPNTPSGEAVNTDGCSLSQTDTDGDGVMDDTDQCSGTPLGEAANTEGCSLSQTDTDGDGVMDDADQCADTLAGIPVDSEGCPDQTEIDSDLDGVTDDIDQCPDTPTGTPVLPDGCPDSDSDGMPDSWEIGYDLDPLTHDAALDPDSDGLSNLEEYQNSTDPSNPDTDADDLNDGDEVHTYGTHPGDVDTDKDGLADGREVATGRDPLDPSDGLFRRLTEDLGLSDQPDAAVDSNGNIHVVWIDDHLSGTWEILYKMTSPSGQTLIDTTLISEDDGFDSVRPVLAIDSQNRIFVVWHDRRLEYVQVFLNRLEPYLDDRDGTAADTAVIKTLGDMQVSSSDFSYTPRLVIDDSDYLHIVWAEEWFDIKYRKLDADGGEIIAEKALDSPYKDLWRSVPDLGLDGKGNVHISWNVYSTSTGNWSYEIVYALLDGATGDTLIAATQLTADDDFNSMRQSISVAGDGKAYIIWQDWGENTGHAAEITFMQIDPYLDDRDGSVADPAVIKTINNTILTPDDGVKSFQPFSRMTPDGQIHVTWHEGDKGTLHHMVVNQNGTVESDSGRLSDTSYPVSGSVWTNAHIVPGVCVVWSDTRWGNREIILYVLDFDVDTDGMPDVWEERYGLDPLLDDAGLDPDSDGLSNLEEYENNADPNKRDSDGDGVDDAREVSDNTDPTDPTDLIIGSAIVGHWMFDEGTGTAATDSSGRENHGAIDGPAYAFDSLGEPGKALFFDGIDDVVTVPDADSLDITDQLTVSAWVRPEETETAGYRVIAAKTGEGQKSYALIQYGSELKFYVSSDGIDYDGQLIVDSMLMPGQWAHVAAIYTGNRLVLYLNGMILGETTFSDPLFAGSAPVAMGYGVIETSDNLYFKGGIDDIRIYTRALTIEELEKAAGFTTISGRVIQKADGNPVSDVWVDAWSENTGIFQSVTTDADGRYTIAGLLPDCYTVTAVVSPESEYMMAVPQFLYVFPTGGIESVVDFELETGGITVTGTVTADGTPVPNVDVTYDNHRYGMPVHTTSDENGDYTLTKLPAGPGEIRVRDYSTERDLAFAGVNVDIGGDIADFDFHLMPGACINGRIIDENGNGLPGVGVHYDNDRYHVWNGNQTDIDGMFEICNLPPGIGWVQAHPAMESGLVDSYERAIVLGEGATKDIGDIELQKGAILEGSMADVSGEPVTGPHVSGSGSGFETDSRVCYGNYRMLLPAGDYSIRLDVHGETGPSPIAAFPVTQTVSDEDVATNARLVAPEMTVYRTGDSSAVSLELSVTGTLPSLGETRVVVLAKGTYLQKATRENLMGIAVLNSLAITETATPFTIDPLPPDIAYDILLLLSSESVDGLESITVIDSVESIDPQNTGVIELSVPVAVSPMVTGQVFGNNGEPVLDALVIIADADEKLMGFAFTDETGSYTIYHLPASVEGITYSAQASHPMLIGNPEASFVAIDNTGPSIDPLHIDTIDPNPPDVVSDSPPDDTTPTWTWTSGGGGNGTFRYQLDSETGTWVETTETTHTSDIVFSDGDTPILYVQERDQAGNWSTSGALPVSIDTPPNPPYVTGNAATNDTTPTWTWSSGGGGNGTFRYQLDGETGTWIETTEAAFTPATEFGDQESHILYVQERDDTENWSVSGSFIISIDTTAPDPPDVTGSTPTRDTTPTWTWISGGGGNGTYRYQFDGEAGTWTGTPETGFTPETPFGDGETHQLYVQERDDAGNWSESGSFTVAIDITGPNPPDVGGQVFTNDTTPTWTWTTGSGGNGTFRYQLDGETGTWVETTDAAFTPEVAFSNGETHILYVQERDDAGNWSTSGSFASTIDTRAPNAPVVTGQATTNDATPTWTWTSEGGGNGTYRYQLDSEAGTWTETLETTFTPATEFGDKESHILYVQERDDTENWSASGSFTISIDTSVPSPPGVTGTTPTQDTTPIWSWTSGGGGNGTFRYQLDSEVGTWVETIETTFTPETAFGDGETRILYVQERNEVGSWSVSGSHTITIDVTRPDPPTLAGDLYTADTTPAWSWSSGGGGNGSYRYQLNSETGTWIETDGTTFTSEIEFADGETHTLYIQEGDDAGNWSLSGSFATRIDTAGPFIETSTPNADDTGVRPDVTMVIHLADTGSGVDSGTISLIVNGGTLAPAQYTVDDTDPNLVVLTYDPDLPLSANQTITVEINGADTLGNSMDAAANTFSFIVRDNTTLTVSPGESIQAVVNTATTGDTISVAAGTYQETIVLFDGHSGIALTGAGSSLCSIEGLQTDSPTILVETAATGVTISGFSITGGNSGILLESDENLIEQNIIQGVSGDGISVYGPGPNTIQNNLIYGNADAGIGIAGDQSTGASLTAVIAQHNTIVDNGGGIHIIAGSPLIQYNVITGNSFAGISGSEASPTLHYNNVWNNGPDTDEDGLGDDDYSSIDPGENDISVDPIYVNAPSHNHQLQAGSPCVDAIPSAVAEADPASPKIDLVGSLRPLPSDQDYDMGAYEYDPDAVDLVFTSEPVTDATEESEYTYQVQAAGAGIRYTFAEASEHPTGMTIDETTGLIAYIAQTDDETGDYDVTVLATDRFNRSETQSFTLAVEAINDTPYFVTPPPIADTREALGMPGNAYTFVVEALDEESPGSEALEYSLGGTPPAGMTIAGFVDDADGFAKARVSWGPSDTAVGTTVTVEVSVSDGDETDSLSWDIRVLPPLTIAPDARVLLRTVEMIDNVEETTELTQTFTVTGGRPFSGDDEASYYSYQLIDVEAGSETEDSRIMEDAGAFQYNLDTTGRPEILYQLKVTDSKGFSRTSGSIEIRNVILVRIADETIADPSAGGEVAVESDDTQYTGATISIPATQDAEADPYTLTFKVVEEASEPVPEDQKGNLGQVIELNIEVGPGMPEPTFDGLIAVTLPFSALDIDPARVQDVRVYTFNEDLNQWEPIDNYEIDEDNQTITFFVSHFSLFAVGLPEIFDQSISGGIDTEDFKMISFPGKPDDPDLLKTLEETLDSYDNTVWRCAAYNNDTKDYDEADTDNFSGKHPLEPGRAYWLITRENKQIATNGLKLNRVVPFDLELRPGWNMVANPFDTPITHGMNVEIQVSADRTTFFDVSDTATNSLTQSIFYRFNPQPGSTGVSTAWYTQQSFDVDSMVPYEGYWLFNSQPVNVTLRFKPLPALSSALEINESSLFYAKLKRFAHRSLHRLAEVISTTGYADEQSREEPPPPPVSMNSKGIGNTGDPGSGGGGCYIDTIAGRD